ncbi:MAG TPA: hypothetical protein VGX37_06440 [Allosphingosinicella sp.]|nr:hypothetical protein [Allosphingosinicella sp.]
MKLVRHAVEKPWGRTDLPAGLGGSSGGKTGEIWFEAQDGTPLPLLVKYIFTSEKLSVQVHPDDAQARARGLERGKSECWHILEAAPDAVLGLGFCDPPTREGLRAAALDGSIEQALEWRPVKPGESYYVPAGMVHAIGPGLSLIEVQQPADVTYRLYDYGRPRELHLDEAVAVARLEAYPDELASPAGGEESRTLVDAPHFVLARVGGGGADPLAGRERFAIPLSGRITAGGDTAAFGDCLFVGAQESVSASDGAVFLVAAAA